MGNLRSVQKAFEKVGCDAVITNNHKIIKNASKVVLPGVGAFKDGMKNLEELGLIDILNEEVLENKKPFLGICLGMQLIASKSYENGETDGLGWVDAEVVKFDFTDYDKKLKIPHVGWNNVSYKNNNLLFDGIANNSDFYFVHSYYFKTNVDIVTSTTDYGFDFVSSVNKNNIYAFQFHPEKSQTAGLKLIENFVNINGEL
ncbi:MAG: imidazole glycerol phosphate synthase, glutamine amidotransferase subunit [Sulfurimonas sp. RIFCSPLOWO2_12_36_12]|nr:MAG: imidazole glycerol phosphate synthase, glutamine amidotransferase subunit [Sulfurimonas sp. RIFCSPLOWO2_02_FULL_36_28]OHE01063.1 MAG: imidazole glycerol phosphate synthase, glutamine amidotransferase subunit [Sulfurimonas sp. RIFCSPLOWO2_12_36_12]